MGSARGREGGLGGVGGQYATKVWPQMGGGRQALQACGPATAAAPQSAWGAQEVAGAASAAR